MLKMKKIKQEFLWNTKDGSRYKWTNPINNQLEESKKNSKLLIIGTDPLYPRIIDISSQLNKDKEHTIIKNPIILQIISNTISNYDNELKIVSSWDYSNEVEQGDINKWTSEAQRLKMFELFYIENLPRSEIAQKLCVSYSTVYKVIRYSELFPKTISSLFRFPNVKLHKWTKSKQKIIEYIKAQSGVFNSTSLKHYIETVTGIFISKQSIASFLRSSLGLSYKRVASRPTKINIPEKILKKIIFWLEFAYLIKPEHILVNIDETLFSRSTKINYSWTMKGVEASVTNSTLIGSLSLLVAITNRGDWYISNLLSRNNSIILFLILENF